MARLATTEQHFAVIEQSSLKESRGEKALRGFQIKR